MMDYQEAQNDDDILIGKLSNLGQNVINSEKLVNINLNNINRPFTIILK